MKGKNRASKKKGKRIGHFGGFFFGHEFSGMYCIVCMYYVWTRHFDRDVIMKHITWLPTNLSTRLSTYWWGVFLLEDFWGRQTDR